MLCDYHKRIDIHKEPYILLCSSEEIHFFRQSNAVIRLLQCQVVQLSGKKCYNFFVHGMYFPHNLSPHPYIEAADSMGSNVYFTMYENKVRPKYP